MNRHNNQNDQLTSTKYYNNYIKLQITGKFIAVFLSFLQTAIEI